MQLPLGGHGLSPRVVAAPGGRLLAIGANPLDGTGGNLTVIDVVAGRVVTAITGIDLEVSTLSSNLPRVELAWRSDRVVRYSRTSAAKQFEWVDHDVRDDKELSSTTYSDMGLLHKQPRGVREDEHARSALVRADANGIWFGSASEPTSAKGEPAVAAPERGFTRGFSGSLQISPRARAAACCVGNRVLVIDGVHKTVRTVFEGYWQFPRWAQPPTDG